MTSTTCTVTAVARHRPRVRQHHSKVRTGCLTCRARHVKCDEGKPACQNCVVRHITCGGYDIPVAKIFEPIWTLPPSPSSGSGSTSSDTGSSETKRETKRRRSAPKQKNGCLPCKHSHVKCDEVKPACLRCHRLNLKCTGYPLVPRVTHSKRSTSQKTDVICLQEAATAILTSDFDVNRVLPMPMIAGPYKTHEEQMGLKYWLVRSKLCEDSDRSKPGMDFLGTHVPTLAWSYESLRNAVVSAGIVCSALERDDPDPEIPRIQALKYENKAIASVLAETSSVQATSLVALMFFLTNIWTGKFDAGMSHLKHGLKLARSQLKQEVAFDRMLLAFLEIIYHCQPEALQNDVVLGVLSDHENLTRQQELRASYVLWHLEATIQWMDDAIRRTKTLRADQEAQLVRKVLEIYIGPMRDLVRRWWYKKLDKMRMSELMMRHRALTESPYAKPMASYNKFLTRDGNFNFDLFQVEMKLTLRVMMLFAAGPDVGMRKDALAIIKMSMKAQRAYGL